MSKVTFQCKFGGNNSNKIFRKILSDKPYQKRVFHWYEFADDHSNAICSKILHCTLDKSNVRLQYKPCNTEIKDTY